MAQYYNIVTDNSVPITLDDVGFCTVPDGQSFRLVLHDSNNGANGVPSLLTYSTSSDSGSASFQHQGAGNQQTAVNTGQNVYIINTEPISCDKPQQPPTLVPIRDHTPRIIRTNPKGSISNPSERQDLQWINTGDFKNQNPAGIKNQTQKTVRLNVMSKAQALAHLAQSSSDKFMGKSAKLRTRFAPGMPTTPDAVNELNAIVSRGSLITKGSTPTFRLKSSLPTNTSPIMKPSARPPIRPENPRPAMQPAGVRSPPMNQPLESLSERIKQSRVHQTRRNMSSVSSHPQLLPNNIMQKPPIRPSFNLNRPRVPLNSQRTSTPLHMQHQRPMPPCPASSDETPERMKMPYNYSAEKPADQADQSPSGEGDSGSESFAYLQKVIDNPAAAIVQQQISGNVVKMLVVLPTGEQRLITFDIPNEECTVQDLLDQANIPFNGQTIVSLVTDTILHINYIVESEAGVIMTMRDTSDSSDPPEQMQNMKDDPAITPDESPVFYQGRFAICPNCGISSMDFNRCTRCKKKLPTDVKAVQMTPSAAQKKETMISITNYYKEKSKEAKFERELAAKRLRGRPRIPGPAKIKPIKEPECLTLSSDEEEDSSSGNKLEPPPPAESPAATDVPDMISEKEPIITNNSTSAELECPKSETEIREAEEPEDMQQTKVMTTLVCRTVRIGSYKYVPRDKIIINQCGLLLAVPLLEDNNRVVPIHVKSADIVKVLSHFGKAMPVLFFYTTPTSGAMIREVLGMQDSKGPYYDPAGKDHTHKRITLLPEKISDESKLVMKMLFRPGMHLEELNSKEANDILVRASPKTTPQLQNMIKKAAPATPVTPATNGRQNERVVQKLTVYPPPPAKSGIAINTEDYTCLGEDQFLNDVIIDFYLKYLTLEILSEEDQQRTHVFSSYFYKRLTSRHAHAPDNNTLQTPASKRHARVQKWTKNVNIFEKDFIIIPINEHAHWFLAIICFPGLVGTVIPPPTPVKDPDNKKKKKKEVKLQTLTIGSTTITPVATTITLDPADDDSERDEAEGDDEEMDMDSEDDEEETRDESVTQTPEVSQPHTDTESDSVVKSPCILIFDSLAGASRSRVVATLRDYLSCEHLAKVGSEKVFSKDTIKGSCPKVPQQSNFTDCGLYVLQYVESFFKDPIYNYTLPIKTLKNWFEEITVTRKREELSNLLIKLMNETKGDKTINLPTVQFPTLDGKLKSENPEKPEQKVIKAEPEVKKKPATEEESSGNSSQQSDNRDGDVATAARNTAVYTTVPSSSSLSNLGDANAMEMDVDMKPKPATTGSTMSYLRNKRISRITSKDETPENQIPAKKHKGDMDSCK